MSRLDQEDRGLAHVASRYSVPETLGRLETLAKSRGLTVFARIDFSGDAQKVGLVMRPAQLLILGNPKAGTPWGSASFTQEEGESQSAKLLSPRKTPNTSSSTTTSGARDSQYSSTMAAG